MGDRLRCAHNDRLPRHAGVAEIALRELLEGAPAHDIDEPVRATVRQEEDVPAARRERLEDAPFDIWLDLELKPRAGVPPA